MLSLRLGRVGSGIFAVESPNGRPEKDRSGKSESVAGHALPAVRIPDSTGRTAPNQYDSGALPEVRSHFHHKRVGLNSFPWGRRERTESTLQFSVRKIGGKMIAATYSAAQDALLQKILVDLEVLAVKLWPHPWKVLVQDRDNQVFCDGGLKIEDNQINVVGARRDAAIMFHDPYSAELIAGGHKLNRIRVCRRMR
jgi:hypothetical protein